MDGDSLNLLSVIPQDLTYTNPHTLLDICRTAAGGAIADLEQDFLDRCVYCSGVILLRIGLVLDKKMKRLECVAQQISYSNGVVDTEVTFASRAEKSLKRNFSSSMPFLLNRLDFHVVSAGEVWKYSRALESYTQPITVAVTTRPKKVGRKRLIDTLTATAANEAVNYDDISNLDELSETHLTDKVLTALQQVRAAAFNDAVQVSFVSMDPDMLYLRRLYMSNVPVSFGVEQLFTDSDIWGQLQALKNLSASPPLSEPIGDTMLRLTALSDCLKQSCISDKSIESTAHHTFIRASAAFHLAKYQNCHAPKMTDMDSKGSWMPMKSIISTYIQEYYLPKLELHTRCSRVPGPFCLDDASGTYLRCSMLVALSSISAKSGATPYEIIELLLTEAESVNTTSTAAVLPYDDSHVRSILLLALSRVRVSSYLTAPVENVEQSSPGTSRTFLRRIREVSEFYLERDLVFSVAAREHEFSIRDVIQERRSRKAVTSAGGILTASALQCMCEVDCQLHPVFISCPPPCMLDSGSNSKSYSSMDLVHFDYYSYLDPTKYSPIVRSSSIECIIKLFVCGIADKESQMCEEGIECRNRAGSELPSNEDPSLERYYPTPNDLFRVAMYVIKTDPDLNVRRNTAHALLLVLQRISPLRMIYAAVSLGNIMECFDWNDPAGFSIPNHLKSLIFGKFKEIFKNDLKNRNTKERDFILSHDAFDIALVVRNDESESLKYTLMDLWHSLSEHDFIATDQLTRSTLFRVWLSCFSDKVPKTFSSDSPRIDVSEGGMTCPHFDFLPFRRLQVSNPVSCLDDVNNVSALYLYKFRSSVMYVNILL